MYGLHELYWGYIGLIIEKNMAVTILGLSWV